MNKADNTKQVRHGILLLKCITLTQTGTTTIKLSKTSTSKHQNNYYTNFVSRF